MIPYGSVLEMLRSRQLQIAQAKMQREQEKKAAIGQFIQLGLMGVGAALGAGIAGPAIGGALGGVTAAGEGTAMGGILGGAGLGQAAGGLLGGAATGTLTPMGAVSGGLGLAGSIYNINQRANEADRFGAQAAMKGYYPTQAGVDADLERSFDYGGTTYAPRAAEEFNLSNINTLFDQLPEDIDASYTTELGEGKVTFRRKALTESKEPNLLSSNRDLQLADRAWGSPLVLSDGTKFDNPYTPGYTEEFDRQFGRGAAARMAEQYGMGEQIPGEQRGSGFFEFLQKDKPPSYNPPPGMGAIGKVAGAEEGIPPDAQYAIDTIERSNLSAEEKRKRIAEVMRRIGR